ncbi:hypothetical protein AB4097_01380 [Microvirga sp. 2MCAF35]|uniref:hypothetical protein n=1 Tax=Microvirga sp. 2MCAF35 TaxID=3232987 RepID=UPI003F951CB6
MAVTKHKQGLRPARKLDYKSQILSEVLPGDFDVEPWREHLYMIKRPDPQNPTTRILLRDGGWCEVSQGEGVVRTWGTRGRAESLAAALGEAFDLPTERLEVTAAVGRTKEARRQHLSEEEASSLVRWWQDRGYAATAAPDGCWVKAGSTRLQDTGDHVTLHGRISDEAIQAFVLKAKEAWNGEAALTGTWPPKDMDRVWLEAQRQGVHLENCTPSDRAIAAWEREKAQAEAQVESLGIVRAGTREAEHLLAGARGDPAALGHLSPELRAFITSYLDDEQRQELAQSEIADVIPELERFRVLGRHELTEHERQEIDQKPDYQNDLENTDPSLSL